MALFNLFNKKKAEPQKKKIQEPTITYKYTSSSSFKGYKRVYLSTVSGYSTRWQKNVDKIVSKHNGDLTNLSVVLEVRKTQDNKPYVLAIVDGLQVGGFYDSSEHFDVLLNGTFSAIHIKNEVKNIIEQDGVHEVNRLKTYIKF